MPSHGSLTKAGKVRSQTPKIQPKEKHKEVPRVRNRKEYEKRVVKARQQAAAR
ncbi:30S ribosomal protein S30e [Sulfolobus islandicus Y.G.57.14]|jgi:SSU ribosomal protein S30E|uniref:30S ribosomal protein S30e n=2 Tax=Saccharolobus islandicus TaxID=43080 RepID=C3NE00_SACI7|nr:30S ribosomal protein S30e [Sulfolobus islandicus]ACP45539.1 30S ribosomal protein S30e [Sulfolobus islandicus Y.G.57.14]ACP48663.1 30S ribosomal protein S30e [Sulfolobus islandicus Y.N.15.51]PVU78595.1 30S ribosomal protein S30e [Sulfolobus islandicus]